MPNPRFRARVTEELRSRKVAERRAALLAALSIVELAPQYSATEKSRLGRTIVRAVAATSASRYVRLKRSIWILFTVSLVTWVTLPLLLASNFYEQPAPGADIDRILLAQTVAEQPLSTAQIVLLCLLSLYWFVLVAAYTRKGDLGDNSYVVGLLFYGPMLGVSFLLASLQDSRSFGTTPTFLSPLDATIAWLPAILATFYPLAAGGFALAATIFVSTRMGRSLGSDSRIGDKSLLRVVNLLGELQTARRSSSPFDERSKLARSAASVANFSELTLSAEFRSIAGIRTARQTGLLDAARRVGAGIRATAADITLAADVEALGAVEDKLARLSIGMADGQWSSLASGPLPPAAPSWWRSHAPRLALGTALVTVTLPPFSPLLDQLGLSAQRPTILFVGLTLLLSLDDATFSRLRELVPKK